MATEAALMKLTRTNKKDIGGDFARCFGFIAVGLIFLFNPVVGVYDFLPDAIGVGLLLCGMRKPADIAPDIAEAAGSLWKLFWICLAQLGLMALMPGIEDKAYSLVFVFILASFEAFFLIAAFGKLFSGLQYLATRFDGGAVGDRLPEVRSLTVVFIILRAFFNLLPELAYLSTTDYDGFITTLGTFDLANYTNILLLVNLAAVTLVGLFWAYRAVGYFLGIRADARFMLALSEYYDGSVATDTKLFARRNIKYAALLMGVGFCFAAEAILDGIDYLPDFIGGALILAGLTFARKSFEEKSAGRAAIAARCYFPAALISWFYNLWFSLKFYNYAIFKRIDTTYMFLATVGLAAVKAVFFIVLIVSAGRYMSALISRHALEDVAPEFKKLARQRENQIAGLRASLAAFKVSGIVCALSSVANTLCSLLFPEYWMLNAAAGLFFVIFTIKLFSELYNAILKKYS